MSKRQEWIDRKIRKLVGEGKSNKQAVAIALAMSAGKKFAEGGLAEGETTDEYDVYKNKVIGVLNPKYDAGSVSGIMNRMSSLYDEENDPQLAKMKNLSDDELTNLADMVDSASTTFKRGEDESLFDFAASFMPKTWVTDAGSRRVELDYMLDQVADIQESTGFTLDEIIALADDLIMSSNKTQDEKDRIRDKVVDELKDRLG